MKPGTLITVFGRYKGKVIAPGKMLPADPQNWVRAEYGGDNGMKVNSFVPASEVKERKA